MADPNPPTHLPTLPADQAIEHAKRVLTENQISLSNRHLIKLEWIKQSGNDLPIERQWAWSLTWMTEEQFTKLSTNPRIRGGGALNVIVFVDGHVDYSISR